MDQTVLEKALEGLPLGLVQYYDSLASTNDEAQRLAGEGCPNLTLVLADQQTAGRGRQGRTWITRPGASLAFSLVLLPPFTLQPNAVTHLTALGALAVTGAIEEALGLQAEIKWPNDVIINGRKTAGVLVEAAWSGSLITSIVLGVGVNVTAGSIPDLSVEDAHFPPTAVEVEFNQSVDRLALLRKIVEKILFWLPETGSPAFLGAWERLLAFRGQWVRVSLLGFSTAVEYDGQIVGLAHDGSLLLKTPDGEVIPVNVGEVRLLTGS